MTDDLITRTTEEFRELRKKLTQALRLVERLIEEQRPSIFNEVYLTSEEIRSMFGISKRTLQTYRDERIIPYTMLGGKFLYPQSAIFEVLERHFRKALRGIARMDDIYTRSFVVPKSIRIGCLYSGRLYFRPKDLRMACTANRKADSAVKSCLYSGCCRMISKRQTLISSSVKTFLLMMRWWRRQRSYSCRNRHISLYAGPGSFYDLARDSQRQ